MHVEYVVNFREELPAFDLVIDKLVAATGLRLSYDKDLLNFDSHESERNYHPFASYIDAYESFIQQQEAWNHLEAYAIKCNSPFEDLVILDKRDLVILDKKEKSYEMHRYYASAEYLLVNILLILKNLGGEYKYEWDIPPWAGKSWNLSDDNAGIYNSWR